jgi:tetratricopeptide (TPR) repeat protein
MKVKTTASILFLGLLATASGYYYTTTHHKNADVMGEGYAVYHDNSADLAMIQTASGEVPHTHDKPIIHPPSTLAGAYLSSHYAQNQNDWEHATALLERILQNDPDNQELIRQSMILAEGAGHHDQAAERAQSLLDKGSKDSLAHLIVTTHAIKEKQYEKAMQTLASLPKGDMVDFVAPLLRGWAQAGLGKFDPAPLKQSTLHAYHGGMIAYYLKQPSATVFSFAESILAPSGLTAEEVERAADLMAISGHEKDAANVYKALQAQRGGSVELSKKIAAVESKGDMKDLVQALSVTTPAQGAGIAILDLARILFQEKSDGSARVFAQMALDMNPQMFDARLLIATSYARSGQIDLAIRQFQMIPESNPAYLSSQHQAAELLNEGGRMDDAVARLNALYETHKNPDSLIRIGDLYRNKEDFTKALELYDRVMAMLPQPLPQDYWYLLYARGMTHERLGNWEKAEKDLTAALEFQPEHPYIMNYLAYAWADQGVNLDKALKMLETAAALRPNDGYITDSLGWAHYKMGQYEKAVPYLESAVELLPYDSEINDHLGDAYWRVDRKVEARFQWERAKNYAKAPEKGEAIATKLANGLDTPVVKKQAASEIKTTPSND